MPHRKIPLHKAPASPEEPPDEILVEVPITVADLADLFRSKPYQLIRQLIEIDCFVHQRMTVGETEVRHLARVNHLKIKIVHR